MSSKITQPPLHLFIYNYSFMLRIYFSRFYDLDSGSLAMEGQDTQGLNIPSVRANLGIVSQVWVNKIRKIKLRYSELFQKNRFSL